MCPWVLTVCGVGTARQGPIHLRCGGTFTGVPGKGNGWTNSNIAVCLVVDVLGDSAILVGWMSWVIRLIWLVGRIDGCKGEHRRDCSACAGMGKPVPLFVKKRLRIQTLLGLQWSESRIAKEVSCSDKTVKRWKKRFEQGESEQDRARPGRPPKLTPNLCHQLKRRVSQHRGRSIRKTAKWLKSKRVCRCILGQFPGPCIENH